ncbi:MAG: hypothetical protein CL917_04115 [Deltaproteobacteria bacterium]|nr:hypothetical protein [Deltaproteobacteria bacterium]
MNARSGRIDWRKRKLISKVVPIASSYWVYLTEISLRAAVLCNKRFDLLRVSESKMSFYF